MIEPRKLAVFERWFARHAEQRLRASFARVHVAGVDRLREATAGGPVVVVANHVSWWDPLVVLWLSARVLEVDGYALMDAANLRRLPFFAAVGAFGVDLGDPSDGARALRFAARLLVRPGRVVWIFPQGAERPSDEPLRFRPGAAEIARVARAAVVPLALRYEHRGEEKPELFVALGEALVAPGRGFAADEVRTQHERAVGAELARIGRRLAEGGDVTEPGFVVRVAARPSRAGALAERLLAALFRPRLRGR